MSDDYKAQLIAVEAKLAKDPENEALLTMKNDLLELIELYQDEELNEPPPPQEKVSSDQKRADERLSDDDLVPHHSGGKQNHHSSNNELSGRAASIGGQTISGGAKRPLSEAELLAKKREKNRKKKEKLRVKIKEQSATAESEKQSWQSFTNKKGLKGITKKSIFASPYSLTGKVGVGTNGIADRVGNASLVGGASASSGSAGPISKQRNRH